jgi:hypothetical protein
MLSRKPLLVVATAGVLALVGVSQLAQPIGAKPGPVAGASQNESKDASEASDHRSSATP